MKQQLALLTLASLASALVPSTNIFTPPWLAQRRGRQLSSTQSYLVPQPLYQTYPTASFARVSPYGSPQQTAYYLQPAYPQVYSSIELAPRHYYPSPPMYTTQYLAPVSSPNTFSRRMDAVKPLEHNYPCPLLKQGQSENYPVYVLPPKNFQPIIYHQQNSVGSYMPHEVYQQGVPKVKSTEEMWYEAEGASNVKSPKTKENKIDIEPLRKKVVLVQITDPSAGYPELPIYEAVIREVKPTGERKEMQTKVDTRNPYNTVPTQTQSTSERDRRLKTKLPVGLTSFFLGGVRGINGRHWNMPADITSQLEFMPNGSPLSPENKYLPEESKVDSEQSLPPTAGDPEKEEPSQEKTPSKKVFEHNTIVDSPLDLEAQESSVVPAKASRQVTTVKSPQPQARMLQSRIARF